MAWNKSLFMVLLLLPLGKSLGRMEKFFSLDLVHETKSVPSWPIFSAGIFVAAAVVLSMFLIVEHLSSYNQPEVY
jgi:hypothetical protein